MEAKFYVDGKIVNGLDHDTSLDEMIERYPSQIVVIEHSYDDEIGYVSSDGQTFSTPDGVRLHEIRQDEKFVAMFGSSLNKGLTKYINGGRFVAPAWFAHSHEAFMNGGNK